MAAGFGAHGSRPNILFFFVDDWPHDLWPSEAGGSLAALLPTVRSELVEGGLELLYHYAHPVCAPAAHTQARSDARRR